MTRRGWAVLVGALLCGLIAVGVWAWLALARDLSRLSDAADFQDRYGRPFGPYVESLRAAGVPTTYAEIEPPMPPDAENAAPEFDAAWQSALDALGAEATWTPRAAWTHDSGIGQWVTTATPAERQELASFLDRATPFLERLDRSLDRRVLRFPPLLDAAGLPDDSWIRRVQASHRLLYAFAAGAERPAVRFVSIRCMARIGERLAREVPISYMVAAAITSAAVSNVRRELDAGGIDPTKARAALDASLAHSQLGRMADLLRAERVQAISLFGAALDGKGPADWPPLSALSTPAAAAPFVAASELLGSMIAWGPLPYASFRSRMRKLIDASGGEGLPSMIVVDKTSSMLARVESMTRLARIALAAAEHRATHGDYPASLADLAWAFPDGVPLDPYTDAAFVYTPTPTGVRIASAGRLADDPAVDEAELRERCLVWELKR